MDNILRLCFHKDPITLDPRQCGDKLSSALIFLLFKGLTRIEADGSIHCDLADSFHLLDNRRRYVFYLGEHFWSNGDPITAHDFVSSIRSALSPSFPLRSTHLFHYLKNGQKAINGTISQNKIGVQALDSKTLEIKLEYPCPFFLELISFCVFFPVHPSMQSDGDSFPVCSGPFQLVNWTKGEEILLKKNPHCRSLFPVHVNQIHIRIIGDEKEAFQRFERGELDWLGNPISPLPVNYLPALTLEKKIKSIAGITCCWFNTQKGPFSNAQLRKAFACAIPRHKLLEKLLLPNAHPANHFYPSHFAGQNSDIFQEASSCAVQLFQSALKELKMKRLKIIFSYEATDEFSRIASLLKAHWENLFQIRILLEPLSFKEFWHSLPRQQFQLSMLCSISQYSEPVNFLEKLEFKNSPINFSGWENKRYQALLKQYRNTMDQKQHRTLIQEIESLLLNEMPIAPICDYSYAYLQQPHVKNIAISPIGTIKFDRAYLEQCRSPKEEELLVLRN